MATDKLDTSQKKAVKVGFFGGAGSGKTQLATVLAGKDFYEYGQSTIGVSFERVKSSPEGGDLQFNIGDTAGQQRFASFMPGKSGYIQQFSEISVICINQNDPHSFAEAKEYAKLIQKEFGDKAPIIIAVTKTDMASSIAEKEIDEFAKSLGDGARMIKTSAKDGIGIEELRAGITDIALGKVKQNLNEMAVKNIRILQPMITAALEPYEKTKHPKRTEDPSLFGKPTPYQALLNFQSALDKAQSFEQYAAAVKQFKRELPEDVLKVQPANVRGGLERLWDALVNWDKKYFADNVAEIAERQRFEQQTRLKGELASVKPEADEPKSSIHFGHNNE